MYVLAGTITSSPALQYFKILNASKDSFKASKPFATAIEYFDPLYFAKLSSNFFT